MMSTTLHLSDGLTARALVAGSGEHLLLLHGVGMRAEAWTLQIQSLAQSFSVVAVDLPGHGASEALPENARLPDFVDWAARVIEALGAGPVNLVGHSMGALIATGLAVERPQLVRRLALISAVHRRPDAARAAVAARAAEIRAGRNDIDGPLDRWFDDKQAALRQMVGEWLHGIDRQGYATAYCAFAEGDTHYADSLAAIRCPVLALTGEHDANSTPQMSRALVAEVAQGEVEILPGERHMSPLTAPELVNAALSRWLARIEVTA
jgi:(E)-2-((N-methylformamido)methylene)succinate hydrolase